MLHLTPPGVVLVVLAVSWRWEWIGAILFFGLGLCYGLTNLRHPSWILTISGPLLLVGSLFLVSWLQRRTTQDR